jgi:hypothetical protein
VTDSAIVAVASKDLSPLFRGTGDNLLLTNNVPDMGATRIIFRAEPVFRGGVIIFQGRN